MCPLLGSTSWSWASALPDLGIAEKAVRRGGRLRAWVQRGPRVSCLLPWSLTCSLLAQLELQSDLESQEWAKVRERQKIHTHEMPRQRGCPPQHLGGGLVASLHSTE